MGGAAPTGPWLTGKHLGGEGLANLEGAILQRADLRDTGLQEAILWGAGLQGAKGLTQEQLEQARGDETTKLPEHPERPKSWI